MSKRTVALLSTAAFVIGAVPATAASGDNSTPGPETPNCAGALRAFLAQGGLGDGVGLGNLARFYGETVQEVQTEVVAYCSPPPQE